MLSNFANYNCLLPFNCVELYLAVHCRTPYTDSSTTETIHLLVCFGSLFCTNFHIVFLYLSISKLQFKHFSPSYSNFSPASCRSLSLRSSALRGEFADCKADAMFSQDIFVRLQSARLQQEKSERCSSIY